MPDPFIAIALTFLLSTEGPVHADVDRVTAAIEARAPLAAPLPVLQKGVGVHLLPALLLVTAVEESRFAMNRLGDSGHSHCALQIWTRSSQEAAKAVTPEGCVDLGIERLRESMMIAKNIGAPEKALAQYCGGVSRKGAVLLGQRRMARALKLMREVEAFMKEHEEDSVVEDEILSDAVPPRSADDPNGATTDPF